VADKDLSVEQRHALLAIARRAVEEAVGAAAQPETPGVDDFPGHGAFVTLHLRGQLRGCIGTFASGPSITKTLREMASAAALRDPRFPAVSGAELEQIDIEISLLTPLRQIEDPASVEVGRHGICIEKGFNRGVLLPQVAVENRWNRDTFLNQTCVKAGLPPDAWRDGAARIEVFEARVFGEKQEGLR